MRSIPGTVLMEDSEYAARDFDLGRLYKALHVAESAAELAGWAALARTLRRKRRRVFIAQVLLHRGRAVTSTADPQP
jgi:hypothetical protein